jgi:microcin C transport system substrate-binding protein
VVVLDARTVRFEFKDKTREQVFTAGTHARVQPQVGRARRWTTSSPNTHRQRALPDRQDRHAPAHRVQAQPQLLGRHWRCGAGTSTSSVWSTACTATTPVAREAFKAGEFDLMKEYRARTWVRQHGRQVGRRPHRQGRLLTRLRLLACSPTTSTCGADLFQDIRVREALGYTYDFETSNKTKVFTRVPQPVQQLRVCRAGHCPAG